MHVARWGIAIACATVLAGGACKNDSAGDQAAADPQKAAENGSDEATAPAPAPPTDLPPQKPLAAQTESSGTHVWSRAFGGLAYDLLRDVAVGADGRVAVTGYVEGTVDFGAGSVTTDTLDAFVAVYEPDGKLAWALTFGGEGEDYGAGVAFDGKGSVIVAGVFAEAMTIGDLPRLSGIGSDDGFVAKLDASGSPQWATTFGGSDSDGANGVAADAAGNIFVTGGFRTTARFGAHSLECAGVEDVFLARLDSDGNVVWVKGFGGRDIDHGQRVVIDSQTNVIVLAEFTKTVDFGGGPLESGGNRDMAVLKYAQNGAHIWSERFGGLFNDLGMGLAVDPAGNLLVTGAFDNAVDFGGGELKAAGEADLFVAKLGPDGSHVWSKAFGGSRDDIGFGVAADAAGNAIVTGAFWEEVSFGGSPLASAGNKDAVLVKLDRDGAHVWSRRFGGKDHDEGRVVAAAADGSVVVGGLFRFEMELGGETLSSTRKADDRAPPTDAFLGRFSP